MGPIDISNSKKIEQVDQDNLVNGSAPINKTVTSPIKEIRTWNTHRHAEDFIAKYVPDASKPEIVPYKGKFAIKMLRNLRDTQKSLFQDAPGSSEAGVKERLVPKEFHLGNITAGVEEKKLAKEFAKSIDPDNEEIDYEIEDSIKIPEDNDKPGEFTAEGHLYIFYLSEEAAIKAALEQVENDLESEPEIFHPDFLQQFIYITDTDKRIIAGEEVDANAENYRDCIERARFGDFFKEIGTNEDEYEELREKLEEADAAKDSIDQEKDMGAYEEAAQLSFDTMEKIEKLAKDTLEEWENEEAEKIEERLKDPIQYFIHDMGAYENVGELSKAPFILVDLKKAADAAVSEDGWAHFLSHYNGEAEETSSGAVYFREG